MSDGEIVKLNLDLTSELKLDSARFRGISPFVLAKLTDSIGEHFLSFDLDKGRLMDDFDLADEAREALVRALRRVRSKFIAASLLADSV